jgi:predicted  nucleic acid-binding Zn-ribbon protein
MDDVIKKLEDTLRDFKPTTTEATAERTYEPRAENAMQAGELSSQIFSDLTMKIISEMNETVEAQLNDAANRKAHSLAQIDELKAEIDKTFSDFEKQVQRHRDKVAVIAEAIKRKVEGDTRAMIELGERLKSFADSVGFAHDSFFKE